MFLPEASENILVNMGSSSSKQTPKEIVKYVESDESERIRLLGQLEKQLKQLKQEVITVQRAISSNVQETVTEEQDDAISRRYGDQVGEYHA